MTTWLALDGRWPAPADAEHAVAHLLAGLGADPAAVVACTHIVSGGTAGAHIAATAELAGDLPAGGLPPVREGTAVAVSSGESGEDGAGPAELLAAAREALRLHRDRVGGRAFLYPGRAAVEGGLTVGQLTARTGIAAVVDLAGRPLPDTEVVQTFDYARPTFTGGQLVLMVGPYADDQHVPFELEHPTQCCAFH